MKNNSEFKAFNRNEEIKNMSKCPPSTLNRIVFLPKIDGVGFRCNFGRLVKGQISKDQKKLSYYSEELKNEVYYNIDTLNKNCYTEWRQNKQKIEGDPLKSQNYQMISLMFLSVIYIITFYIFYSRQSNDTELTIFYVYVILLFVLIGFCVIVMVQVIFKKYQDYNLDSKINNCIKDNLQSFNKDTLFNLQWIKPDGKHWIYVKIPQGTKHQKEDYYEQQ